MRGRDAKIIDWLDEMTAECPKKIAHNMNDPCGAKCPQLPKVAGPQKFAIAYDHRAVIHRSIWLPCQKRHDVFDGCNHAVNRATAGACLAVEQSACFGRLRINPIGL